MWSLDSKLAVCGRIRNVEGSLFHGLICFIPAEFQTTEVLEREAGKEGGREGGREERKGRGRFVRRVGGEVLEGWGPDWEDSQTLEDKDWLRTKN